MDMALRDANEYRSLIDSYLDREDGEVEKATATMTRRRHEFNQGAANAKI